MKIFGFVVTGVFFVTTTVFAAPDWVSDTPNSDSSYHYYVGRGESSSEKKAFDAAVKDAYDQAARENFASEYTFQSDIYQTENDAFVTERSFMSGQTARFDGFRKKDEYIIKTKNGYSVKLLYSFSKKSIQAEQKRLKEKGFSTKRSMSVMGDKSNAGKGVLVVKTTPVDGAVVYVDGERFGQTPVTLYGALTAGRHSLRIDHPKYKTVDEKVIIVPNKTVEVQKTLVPAFATVDITTDPVDADVFIDGKKIGVAPVKYSKIPAEKEIVLTLTHPEVEKVMMPLTLRKDEKRPLNIMLSEKNASVSFFSFPKGASVFIDKMYVGLTPIRHLSVARGSHSYTIEKENYTPKSESFYAKGGEEIRKSADLKALPKTDFISKSTEKVTLGVDKYHRFEQKTINKKSLSLSSASTAEDVLLRMMKWSYPSNFIQSRVSYGQKDKGTFFFVFLSFNQENYKTLFLDPVERALKNVSEKNGTKELDLDCFYDSVSDGQFFCPTPEVKGQSDTVFVKSAPNENGFFSDSAVFDTYQLLTADDGRRNHIKNFEKRKVALKAYNRSGSVIFADSFDLYLTKFEQDKNRNVVFFPAFKGGFQDYLYILNTNRIKASQVNRVTISISDGTAIDNPYPPFSQLKENAAKKSKSSNRTDW